MELSKAREFIAEAKLPTPPPTPPGTFKKKGGATEIDARAVVNGPQVVTFDEGISPPTRRAVLDATLFSALAANAVSSRRGSPEWIAKYRETLVPLGWSPAGDTRQTTFENKRKGQVHEAVIEFLEALALPAPALVVVRAALMALKKVGDDQPWITVFEQQTAAQKLTGFNIATVAGKDTALRTQLSQFTLKGSAQLTQVLFLKFQKDSVSMDASTENYDINVGRLIELQPDLEKRLQAFASQMIAEVPLAG